MSNKETQAGPEYLFEKTQQVRMQRKRRKRRRHIVLLLFCAFLCFVGYVYYCSDASRICYISIDGNTYLSKTDILSLTEAKEGDMRLFTSRRKIVNRLLTSPFIKEASVELNHDGMLSVTIVEKQLLGYWYEDPIRLLLEDTTTVEITAEQLHLIVSLPWIEGFTEEAILQKLTASLLTINANIRANIAKISPYQQSYDENMLKITMQDGNTIFSAMSRCNELNQYYDILKVLKVTNSCIYIEESSGNAYSSVCPVPVEETSEETPPEEEG